MTGPFETEREARELAAVQAIYEAFRNDPGVGRMTPHVHRMLVEACAAAGVQLGAYDRRVLAWLAGWEPQTAAVVAGLISRANTTAAAPAPETRMVGEVRAVLAAFDWECGDRQLALDAIDRIVLAGAGPAPAEGPAAPASADTVALTAEQLATVIRALADAQTLRMREADEFCRDCETSPAGACWQHLSDLDAAQAYHDLAGILGSGR